MNIVNRRDSRVKWAGIVVSLLPFAAVLAAPGGARNCDARTGACVQRITPVTTTAAPAPAVVDPDLAPGFPVKTYHNQGGYQGGPAINTVVGNIDGSPDLEIMVSGLAQGPVYAWKSDGTPVPGWPVWTIPGVAYPALGTLTGTPGQLDVFASYETGLLTTYAGDGTMLPGWPRPVANYVRGPGAMADWDGDGVDEMFICEEDSAMHMYRADGSSTVVAAFNGQSCVTPAIADIDGDGAPEVVVVSGYTSGGTFLEATNRQGYDVPGFPVLITYTSTGYVYPAVGDVDGDGVMDIVVVVHEDNYPWRPLVKIVSNRGVIKRTMTAAGGMQYGAAPALADLDGDRVPEIVVETDGALNVFRGDGSTPAGWPVLWPSDGLFWSGNSAPVVGDLDGDWRPDIAVTMHRADISGGDEVRVYNPDGVLHPRFPKNLALGDGAVPAIADIDRDGRNELIVTGAIWGGVPAYLDKVWVYDLGGGDHGPVQWGQFGGGAGHGGVYTLHAPGERGVAPVADAGPDQTALQRTVVTLDGSASVDPDGRITHANWRQVSGMAVGLANPGSLTTQFTAPGLNGTDTAALLFELTVTDNDGATRADRVMVTVKKR